MNYRFFVVLSLICLYLAFNASVVFGQRCGIPGLPKCRVVEVKKEKVKRQETVNDTQIYKPGITFFEKSSGQSLFVTYKENGKDLVFLMEALNSFSNEKSGEMHIYVDLNRNGKIDVSDIRYKLVRDGEGYNLESNYLSNKYFESAAVVGYSFIRTKQQSRPHPLFSITIPKLEVFFKSGEINIRFEYWSEACADCVVRIPAYNIANTRNIRDEKGLLDFGPVKKIGFTP